MATAPKASAPAYAPLEVGPRTIPMPKHVSPEAKEYIAMPGLTLLEPSEFPPLNDKEGWRKNIAEVNEMMKMMEDMVFSLCPVSVERTTMNGARVAIITPKTEGARAFLRLRSR